MMTEEILRLTKKVRRYLLWSQVAGVIKVILILGPIIFALIFLPPYISTLLKQYQSVLSPQSENAAPYNLDLNSQDWQKLGDYLKGLPSLNR